METKKPRSFAFISFRSKTSKTFPMVYDPFVSSSRNEYLAEQRAGTEVAAKDMFPVNAIDIHSLP